MDEEEIERLISERTQPLIIRGWGLDPNTRFFELIYDGPFFNSRIVIRFWY